MAFEYRPYANPYVGSMIDLMGRGEEARSRAELSAAEIEAGAQRRLGDITGAQWSGLGQTIGQGMDAYVTEQREAPIRAEEARLRALNIAAAETQAERAAVLARREDKDYDLKEQERAYGRTFDRIIADAELAVGNDPDNREAYRDRVREQIAQFGLPASYGTDFNEMVQADELHASNLAKDQAQIEAAQSRGASDAAILERAERRDEFFDAIKTTADEFGYNSRENRAARANYFAFIGEADPVREHARAVELANIQASSRPASRAQNVAIENLKGAMRVFLRTGNEGGLLQARQMVADTGLNPENVEAEIAAGLDAEAVTAYRRANPFSADPTGMPDSITLKLPPMGGSRHPVLGEPWADGAYQSPVITEEELRNKVQEEREWQVKDGEEPDYTLEQGVLDVLSQNRTIVDANGQPSEWMERGLRSRQLGGFGAAIGASPSGARSTGVGGPGDTPELYQDAQRHSSDPLWKRMIPFRPLKQALQDPTIAEPLQVNAPYPTPRHPLASMTPRGKPRGGRR